MKGISAMMKMATSRKTFDSMRERDMLMPHVYYMLPEQVGFCPDGVGMVWYGTIEEAEAAHG